MTSASCQGSLSCASVPTKSPEEDFNSAEFSSKCVKETGFQRKGKNPEFLFVQKN